jgi:glucosamine 6-phosphate synthetase-like amidotransferase/phosphosugar isomerase protein
MCGMVGYVGYVGAGWAQDVLDGPRRRDHRGHDVDQPRIPAESVVVE